MAANKVLLVDDDPGIIEVLKLYFEKEGYFEFGCLPAFRAVSGMIFCSLLFGQDGTMHRRKIAYDLMIWE